MINNLEIYEKRILLTFFVCFILLYFKYNGKANTKKR